MTIIYTTEQINNYIQNNDMSETSKEFFNDYITLFSRANNNLLEKCDISRSENVRKNQLDIFEKKIKEKTFSLGVSMIVFNEERCIRRAVQSVLGIIDQLVIVDTGSTDRTIPIIEEISCDNKTKTKIILLKQKWTDSFSNARNLSLDYIDTDWCLTMDADETLEKKTNIYLFLSVFGEILKKYDVFSVCIVDTIKKNESYVPRLFLVSENIRYVGHVHEELRVDNTPTKSLSAPIFLNHDGYSEKIIHAKNKYTRNMRLITKDLQNEPKNHRWSFYKIRDQIGSINQSNIIEQINELLYKGDQLRELDIRNSSYDLPLLNMLSFFYYSQHDSRNIQRVCTDIVSYFGENSNTLYFDILSNIYKVHNVVETSINRLVKYEQRNKCIDEYQPIADNYSHLDFLIAILLLYKGNFELSINYMNITKDNFNDKFELQRYDNIIKEASKYFKEEKL